jgi:tripeptidyl-peptidase-1
LNLEVKDAEKLLDTKYSVFKHEDGTELIRAPQWSLPQDLHQHIVAVQPTNSYLRNSPQRFMHKPAQAVELPAAIQRIYNNNQKDAGASQEYPIDEVCHQNAITPLCLRNIYKTVNYVPSKLDDPSNVMAFANYLNETSMDSDLQEFLKNNRPEATNVNINFTIINGGGNFQDLKDAPSQELNGEGNLDGQTLVAMVYPMKVKAYNTGGKPPFTPDKMTPSNTNEPYLEWLDYMLNKEANLPYTVSTSYGDDEQTVPPEYAKKVCEDMAKLGARGVTLLFASGDNGVGQSGTCTTNDGKNTEQFLPSFPDGCPYVTSVGGTKYQPSLNASAHPEVVAYDPSNKFAPGGGFSNYFPTPDYQQKEVASYLKGLGDQFKGSFNATGRAYPDVAGLAQSYTIQHGGNTVSLDGTSASTPTVGGVIALLNDYRIANGKKPFGFLNPWLYSVGGPGFFDITSGSAKGCGGEGFAAGPGWDAVTGFGTPVSL